MSDLVIFSRDEIDLIAALAGCSLDTHPGASNWVQDAGGLPEYICEIARAILRGGKKDVSSAIAIAVSRVKKWAAGVGVDKDTQAKAAKALAEWEAKRVKAKAKKGIKKAAGAGGKDGKKVEASHVDDRGYVNFAASEYNVSIVADAWSKRCDDARDAYTKANPNARWDDGPRRAWVKETWNNFLIVSDGYGEARTLYKVPYTVDTKLNVSFEDPEPVKTQYVAVPADDIDDTGLDDVTLAALASTRTAGCMFSPVLALTVPTETALDRVLRFAADSSKPYGDVTYADPGFKGGRKRYPIDTAAHVRAAWSYVNQEKNQSDYTPAQVASIKAKIRAAAKKVGVDISDD